MNEYEELTALIERWIERAEEERRRDENETVGVFTSPTSDALVDAILHARRALARLIRK